MGRVRSRVSCCWMADGWPTMQQANRGNNRPADAQRSTAGWLAGPRAQSCSGLQGRSLHVRRYFCVHDGRPGTDGMVR